MRVHSSHQPYIHVAITTPLPAPLRTRRNVEEVIMATSGLNTFSQASKTGLNLLVISLLMSPLAHAADPIRRAAAQSTIPMTTKYWTVVQPDDEITFYRANPDITYVEQEGVPQGLLVIKKGAARLKDVEFQDGTIEYDMKPIGEGSPATIFHRHDHDSGEVLYVRVSPDCPISNDCLQYAPIINGNMLWDAYPQYQSPAPINPGGWNHLKIVMSGRRMNVFVNGAATSTLSVGHLESSARQGWLEFRGPAVYANLRISAGNVDQLPPTPLSDPSASDPGYVRNWRVSPFTLLPPGKDIDFGDRPAVVQSWKRITTEQSGAINLTRLYKTPDPGQLRCVAWLTTEIDSSQDQRKTMSIGWLREIWVFVNGKLVFSGKNFWDPPGPKLTPDGRISLENGSFDMPLKQGHNRVDIAISNENSDSRTHYGWGLQLKARDVRGIIFPGSSEAEEISLNP